MVAAVLALIPSNLPITPPLHLIAKCSYRWLPTNIYNRLLDIIFLACGNELTAVDNRGSTAFLLAVGGGNAPFLAYCVGHVYFLEGLGIDWSRSNTDGVNALEMSHRNPSNTDIHNRVMHLAHVEKFGERYRRSNTFGGSSANRRDRSQQAMPGTRRAERQRFRNRSQQRFVNPPFHGYVEGPQRTPAVLAQDAALAATDWSAGSSTDRATNWRAGSSTDRATNWSAGTSADQQSLS